MSKIRNKRKSQESKLKWDSGISCITLKKTRISQKISTITQTLSNPSLKRKMMLCIFDSTYTLIKSIKYFDKKFCLINQQLFYKKELNKFITFQQLQDKMGEVSPQKLLKKVQLSSNVKLISDFFSQSKIKVSKQVYNLETRNIKLFIKQQREIQAKRKEEHPLPKRSVDLKKRYDENQLLELQYKFQNGNEKPVYIERCQTQPSQITQTTGRKNQQGKQSNKMTSQRNLQSLESSKIFINRPKRVTHIDRISTHKSIDSSLQNLPRIALRKKSKSTFQDIEKKFKINEMDIGSKLRRTNLSQNEQSIRKSSSSIVEFSNKIASRKKHNFSSIKEVNDKLIEITDDKMIRYIKSLHILINGAYQYGKSLDEEKANTLIEKRYTPFRKANSNNKKSEGGTENKKFQFPYLEFISQSQTRKSIHRIVNMSVKNTQRVVFKLLDFNRNGFIDQKDLIDLIELSQKIPDLRPDLMRIAHYVCRSEKFSISNANSLSFREQSQRHIQKLQDIPEKHQTVKTPKKQIKFNPVSLYKIGLIDRNNTYQSSQLNEFVSQQKINKKQSNIGSSSFNKERLYSFIQTKNKFFNSKKNKQEFRFTVNLQDFHQIFGHQRPATFINVLIFLFNVKQQDLVRQNFDQSHSYSKMQKKQNKIKKEDNQGFKNYDVPSIIKDMEKKFQNNIQMYKYEEVLDIEKISQRKIKRQ